MPPHNRFPPHDHLHMHPPHMMEHDHMANPIEIEAILSPTFGAQNAAILVRSVEYARPLEAGPKLALGAHTLKSLVSTCDAAGVDVDAATAWLKQPIDTSHPRAMAYSLVYSVEGSSLFSKTLNEADAENMRHRLTHGPMEMQANTILELATSYLVMKLAETLITGVKDTKPKKAE